MQTQKWTRVTLPEWFRLVADVIRRETEDETYRGEDRD